MHRFTGLSPSYRPWFWFFLENWLYVFKKVPPFESSASTAFWSLALEEQYYLSGLGPSFGEKAAEYDPDRLWTLGILFAVRFIIWNTAGKNLSIISLSLRIEGLCVGSLLAIATWFKACQIRANDFQQHFGGPLAGCRLPSCFSSSSRSSTFPFSGLGGYLLIY